MNKPIVKKGILWCPFCGKPHKLTDRYCSESGEPLDASVHRPSRTTVTGPLVGTTIGGRYRVRALLGAGGMGEVYEAENLALGRRVAIKVVSARRRRDLADAIPRLLREARAVAAIHHPNICDVQDVGSMPDGSPYVVFERLFGETLDQRLRAKRKQPPSFVIDVFGQILAGLRAAHEAGIVHRDLKPANVFLVDRRGLPPLVKLLDFGFAKDLSVTSPAMRITRPGRACGTPQYMSPEQLRAQDDIDGRSDVFSAGVIMYETLTGRHPFPGASIVEIGTRILREDPLPVCSLRRAVPPAFDVVLRRAMAKKREDRYRSALEMQVALLALAPEPDDDVPDSTTDTITLLPRIASSSPSPTPSPF